MSQGKPRKEYLLHKAKASNKSLFQETTEEKILRELKKDEIADDKWLDKHRLKAIRLALKFKEKEMLDDEIKVLEKLKIIIKDEVFWDIKPLYKGRFKVILQTIEERLQKLKGDKKWNKYLNKKE